MHNQIHFKFWTKKDRAKLAKVRSFGDLCQVALDVIRRNPLGKVHMVSGPITTGGTGTLKGNLAVFQATIEALAQNGYNVFSQIPFEEQLVLLHNEWRLQNSDKKGYCMPILYDFYEPIFTSGLVEAMHFIPDWRSSFGAKWEHEITRSLGIKHFYLPEDWSAALKLIEQAS